MPKSDNPLEEFDWNQTLEELSAKFNPGVTWDVYLKNGLSDELVKKSWEVFGNNILDQADTATPLKRPDTALVIRNGWNVELRAEEVAVGDLAIIKAGESFPADVRIVFIFEENGDVTVDQCGLTGDSGPQLKSTHSTNDNPLQNACYAFWGTTCVSGRCIGLVMRVGQSTVLGKLNSQLRPKSKCTIL